MEASASLRSPICALPSSKGPRLWIPSARPGPSYVLGEKTKHLISEGRAQTRITAIDIAASTASAQPEITWQIVVGAIAGVTPFVVAGIEFSKRIVAQRKCEVCGGSGLVQEEESYFRCPGCGKIFLSFPLVSTLICGWCLENVVNGGSGASRG
ncbi:hypothetical protein H6P81_005591 [Aristolochia fimbriata]|uniref:Viral late gene transcription factor 3 zinc ribbon domain-containing protein n=1 Tax=Aristolochia fimbriata TaxID=158543 RepID=A0AAV7EYQ7_ARIFI|nr:hypothetical protein H6P81_005591 [Aristolochia fimbriata]